MTEDYLSKIKEADETITRIKHEELQDFIIEEIDKRFDQILKGIDLTEQQEQSVLRLYNYRVGSENFLKGITSFKWLVVLVCTCVSLIVLLTAAWWWYISGRCDDLAEAQYKKYIEQSKENGSAWAMTTIGKEAQAMDKAGLLKDLIHCQLKGFVKVKGKNYCSSEKRGAGFELLPN